MKRHSPAFLPNVLCILFFFLTQLSVGQIFVFNFENTTNVTTDNAIGTPTFSSSGIGAPGYNTTGACQGTRMYTANNWDNGDYYEFTVNTTGYGNLGFSFCNRTDNTSVGTFIVRVSSDGGDNWTTVRNTFTPTTSNNTITTSTFPASANNQSEVLIQIYKTSSPNNARTYLIDSATLTGTAIPGITSLSAAGGCVGSSFTITGVNFTGITGVTVNGTAVASYTVNSPTSISATIASGNTTGEVGVTNANGTGTSSSDLTVYQPSAAGTINGGGTVCSGTNSTILTLSGNTGTIQWQSSTDNSTFININGQTASTYTATNLTATRYYRAVVTSGTCSSVNTSSVAINVNAASAAGTISGATAVCSGTNSTVLTLSGNTGAIQWQSSPDNSAWTNIGGATSSTYTATNLTSTTYYRVVVTSGVCASATSASVTMTINSAPVSVSATASATTVCAGGSINLTASATPNSAAPVTLLNENFNSGTNSWTTGGTPALAAWTLRPDGYEYSTSTTFTFHSNDDSQFYMSNSDTPGNGSTTSTTLQSPSFSTVGLSSASLSFHHFYRYWDGNESANVEISTNGTTWTSLAQYTTTQGAQAAFANPTISLNGYLNQPTVYIRFRYAATFDYYWLIDNVSVTGVSSAAATYAWTSTPAGFTSSLQNPANVTPVANTTYTVTVTNSYGCSASATSTMVNVNPASVAGTIGGATTVCSGTNSTVLTLSGNTGTIQWQSSPDNSAWTNIGGATSSTYTVTNLTSTTYYRVVVTSGTCASAASASVTMTVSPASVAGTIGGATTVCSGTNSTTLTLNGNTGAVQWQSSPNNSVWTNIGGATASAYTATNLSSTTYYRVVVSSSGCTSANSASVAVTVSPVSVAGSISGATTVCAGTNSSTLTLSGYVGTIQWQSSVNNVSFSNIAGATSATYTATNLTVTTYYRAVVSSGVCSAATTFGSAEITVNPASVAGNITGAATVCSGTNSTVLTLVGNTGAVQWQSSPDNSAWTNVVGATSPTYTATNLSASTYYRAVVTSGVCTPVNSSSVMMAVTPTSVAGTINAANNVVCAGTNSTLLTVTGNTGTIQWQSSADDSTFVNIPGATLPTYTATNLTATSFYRVVVSNGSCSSVASASIVIDVTPVSVAGTISGGGIVCAGSNVVLTLSGNTGSIQWQSSPDNAAWTNISGATASACTITNVTSTGYYRAVVTSGGCSSANAASVMIGLGNSTTWNGTAWSNGVPASVDTAYITGNYTSSVNGGSISACSLTVDNNAVVIISSGDEISLNGALVVNPGSSLTLENNANLLQATDAANTGTIIVKRNSSALKRLDYTLWSSPVEGQELLAFSPATVSNRFYTYNTSTNLYNAITPAGTDFEAAKGYLIRMPNNHPTFAWTWNGQFAGVPHNGPYNFTMADGGSGLRFNLVGNPYPSPISMDDFIAANAPNITGALYFWRKTNNSLSPSYCSWAAGTFTSDGEAQVFDPQGIIRTGQGFFVEGNGNGSSLVFDNSMRVGNTDNQFFRQANVLDKSRIWLNAANAEGAFSQMALVYVEGGLNDAVDMFDGRYINDGDIALNSMIGGVDYVIQGRAPFVPSDVVPLSFKATTAGSYTISIDHLDGLFAGSQNIYLKDNLTGAQHDLKAGAYTFTCEAGTSTGRFEVIYQLPLGTPGSQFDENHVIVYKHDDVFVVNTGSIIMDNIRVFDIRGRLLLNKIDINASQTTFDAGGANQVLIVKITSDSKQTVTKKVVN